MNCSRPKYVIHNPDGFFIPMDSLVLYKAEPAGVKYFQLSYEGSSIAFFLTSPKRGAPV